MAEATRVTVTASAGVIVSNDGGRGPRSYLVKNATGTASVFIGGSGVTTDDGFEWTTDEPPLSVDLPEGEALYGVAATDQALHVLELGD